MTAPTPPCRRCAARTRWCARWRDSRRGIPRRHSPPRSTAALRASTTCCRRETRAPRCSTRRRGRATVPSRVSICCRPRADRERLAAPDERFMTIAGIGQPTVTGVARRGDDFLYTITRAGDGTVPASSAALAGTRGYFTRTAHSDLTRDREVAAAVVDLLRHGATRRLPGHWRATNRAQAHVSDAQLRRLHASKVNWGVLSPDERRVFLQNLNEPVAVKLRAPAKRAGKKPRR